MHQIVDPIPRHEAAVCMRAFRSVAGLTLQIATWAEQIAQRKKRGGKLRKKKRLAVVTASERVVGKTRAQRGSAHPIRCSRWQGIAHTEVDACKGVHV